MKRLVAKILLAAVILIAVVACSGGEPPHLQSESPYFAVTPIAETEPALEHMPPVYGTDEPFETTKEPDESPVENDQMPEYPPMVALTFDDGPSRHTDRILDILERYDARATFFVIGNRLKPYRSTVKRAVALGNEIANHTYTHTRLTSKTDSQVIIEIQSTSAAIASITGFSPPIYRPPFGATDERILNISAELGYGIVKWTLDPVDWRERDAEIIYYRIMHLVEDGSVILLHDILQTTAQAMERVIPSLIERGFQLVTVSELIQAKYGGLEAGKVLGSYCAIRAWD